MTSYVTPKKNTAFIFYAGLPSQAAPGAFKANPTLAAGDFQVSIDGGALANLGTLPTVTPASGRMVKFSLSASEMNGDNITVVCSDAAGAEWYDVIMNIQTSARQVDDLAYPATSGRSMVVDANGLVDATAVKVGPSGSGTAQTARDVGASVLLSSGSGTGQLDFTSGVVKANATQLLGTAWLTPGTAGTPDVNVKLWNGLTTVALPLVPTTAGRTLDVSSTGEAGVDWANVGGQSTSVNLSATTTNLVNTATTVTNQLTAAAIATGVWQDATAGDFTTVSSIGKALYVSNVAPGGAGGHFIAGTNAATSITTALTANIIGNITGNLSGAVGSVTAGVTLAASAVQAIWDALTSALTTVGSIGKLLVTNIDAAISSRGTSTLTQTQVTGGAYSVQSASCVLGDARMANLDATVSSRLASASYTIPPTANANADALFDRTDGIETGWTFRQVMRIFGAVLGGKVSGAGTGTEVFRDITDAKNRVTATVDNSGNRTAITLDNS